MSDDPALAEQTIKAAMECVRTGARFSMVIAIDERGAWYSMQAAEEQLTRETLMQAVLSLKAMAEILCNAATAGPGADDKSPTVPGSGTLQ